MEIQRRKPKQDRSLEKYNSILDACSQVLAEKSYENTTVTDISYECDIPYATIYQYFKNKDDIMVAWVERMLDQVVFGLTAKNQSLLDSAELNEHIDAMVEETFSLVSSKQNHMKQIFDGVPDMLTSKLLKVMEDRTIALISALFSEQIENSNQEELDFSLRILVKMVIGYFLQAIIYETLSEKPKKEAKEIATIIKSYLKTKDYLN